VSVGRTGALALLVTGALAAAGCGSKSPAQRYAGKVNAMCADFATREKTIGEPRTQSDLTTRGDRIVAAYEQSILQPLEALPAPPEVAKPAARLLVVARKQRDVLKALADAGRVGDVQRVQLLVGRNQQLNVQAGAIARELKADNCTG
jgi:hypothetical protein